MSYFAKKLFSENKKEAIKQTLEVASKGKWMSENRRILVIDDDEGIRQTYQDIFTPAQPSHSTSTLLKGMALFDSEPDDTAGVEKKQSKDYEVTLAENGSKGVEAVQKALDCGKPFAVAFIDMKMPGIDGAETSRRIWQLDPDIKILIVTAYSEYTPEDIINVTKREDLFYLRKPFNHEEILQFARALSNEWNLEKKRETLKKDLKRANENLEEKVKQQAAMIVQSEKMATIGLLAAGVAHEINNPITFINANLSALKKYLKKIFHLNQLYETMAGIGPDEMETIVEKIDGFKEKHKTEFIMEDLENLANETIRGIERIKNIVQDLKTFSRKDESDYTLVDINETINATLKLVENELKQSATITKDLDTLPQIKCFPQKISQVLLNLLINAGHAIEAKGTIGIATAVVSNGRRKTDQFVQIKITDTGRGIPEEHLSRLFDPFFTTKPVGTGTGLGLSVAYEIITAHKGQINADSTVGEGTCFTILLPVHRTD